MRGPERRPLAGRIAGRWPAIGAAGPAALRLPTATRKILTRSSENMKDTIPRKTTEVERVPSRGAKVVAILRGRANGGLTTDEIMKLTRG